MSLYTIVHFRIEDFNLHMHRSSAEITEVGRVDAALMELLEQLLTLLLPQP